MVSAVHQRNDVHTCVARFASMLPQLNSLADEIAQLRTSDVDLEAESKAGDVASTRDRVYSFPRAVA